MATKSSATVQAGHRVLVVRTNPIAPDPRVQKLAQELTLAGKEVSLLGWDRSGGESRPENRTYGTTYLISIRAGFGRGLGNLLQLLRWELGQLRWLIRHQENYDVIHACDFDTLIPALVAKRIYGKKVVYDIFDFYADHLRATPSILRSMIRRFDLWAIGRVDAIILADVARKEQIIGSRPRKLVVINNTPHDYLEELQATRSHQQTVDSKSHAASIKLDVTKDGKRTRSPLLQLTFVGLLQVERGLLELLEILGRRLEWSLNLAGFGGDEWRIARKAETHPNIHFFGRVPYRRALELMSAADALIATYDPRIPNHRYASPNKLFEAMMLAKPIVVARGTNMDLIVEKYGCGLVIPYGDVPALEEALAKLASDPDLRAQLGGAGRRAYESTYSWDIMSQRLLALYSQL